MPAPRRDGDVAELSATVPRETIERLEELGFNAWPALHTILREGWVLRFTDGYTKRANSANPLRPGDVPLPDLIAEFEAAYVARALRPIFRITPLAPPGLDAALAARGYLFLDQSFVQLAPVAADIPIDPQVEISPTLTASWLDGYAATSAIDANATRTLRAMLERIPAPTAYARAIVDGRATAFGFAALERGHIGLFDIVTARDARRHGFARRLVGTLMAWGAANGAAHAYLQVVAANAPARRLYEGLGFTTAYPYHYRIAPP